MGTVVLVAFFWVAFAGTHVWLSGARVRPRLVGRLGEQPYLGLYSLVALATFVPLVWIFWGDKNAGPRLWSTLGPPALAHALNYALMLLALALFVAALVPGATAPSAMQARGPAAARGIVRVTRHPMFVAFGLFGIAHLLVNGSLAAVIFFAGFPVFAWIGARHQDTRKTRDRPGYADLVAATSIVPFGAIVSGRQRLVAGELPMAGLGAGLVLAIVLRVYHGALFGP